MKKLMLILAVLAIATPAMAAVTLSLDAGGNADGLVAIKYTSTGSLPRAFALNVSVDEGTITGYNVTGCQPYRIYMGTIVIENGVIPGSTPVAPASAPDAPGQLGTASIVIEMGSLYDSSIPSNPEKPLAAGTLINLQCSSTTLTTDMTVTSNALRGKIVNEDTTVEDRSVTGPVNVTGVCYTKADIAMWNTVGSPASWCNNRQCRGDADKLDEPYGNPALHLRTWVGNNDITILVAGYKKAYTNPTLHPWIAADFNHLDEAYGNPALHLRCRVGNADIAVLVANYKKSVAADCGQTTP